MNKLIQVNSFHKQLLRCQKVITILSNLGFTKDTVTSAFQEYFSLFILFNLHLEFGTLFLIESNNSREKGGKSSRCPLIIVHYVCIMASVTFLLLEGVRMMTYFSLIMKHFDQVLAQRTCKFSTLDVINHNCSISRNIEASQRFHWGLIGAHGDPSDKCWGMAPQLW